MSKYEENQTRRCDPGFGNIGARSSVGRRDKKKSQFEALKSKLQGINPYKVLQRGFALISDENGNIIKSVDEIKIGNNIKTQFKDGSITSKVINKDNKE